jgi:trans-aconitate methyltransferase
VIDAACGPGSLSRRLLNRFPLAKVIAVDADAMLLEMARASLALDSLRAVVVEADLASDSWPRKVLDAAAGLNADSPAVVVSTTALH